MKTNQFTTNAIGHAIVGAVEFQDMVTVDSQLVDYAGFVGNGQALTALNATELTTGFVSPSVVATGVTAAAGPFLTTNGAASSFSYNGGGMSNLNAGNLASGTLPAGRFPALTGDITTTAGSVATTMKSTGTAGTYRSVTFDAQGRETSGSNPTTFGGYGLSDTSANLAAALTDETGSGSAVFSTTPNLTNITIFDSSAGLANIFGTSSLLRTNPSTGAYEKHTDGIMEVGNNNQVIVARYSQIVTGAQVSANSATATLSTNGNFYMPGTYKGGAFQGSDINVAGTIVGGGGVTLTGIAGTRSNAAVYLDSDNKLTGLTGVADGAFLGTASGVPAWSYNGGTISNLSASSLASGTVADGRLSANVALLNGTQTFTGVNTFSNSAKLDAAHTLSLSNATASRLAFISSANTIISAAASGAVPVDADGSATTAAQILAVASNVATNNGDNNFSAAQTVNGGNITDTQNGVSGTLTSNQIYLATGNFTTSINLSNSAAVGTTNLQLLPSVIRVIAPAQASASVAGSPLAISAANATAGSSSAGAAAGGSVAINGGNAAQLTSGNGNGGALTFTSGNAAGFGAPGDVTVTLGSAPNGFNTVPVITLSTPNSAVPGKISLTTGNSTVQTSAGGTGGDVTVANGSGGDLFTSGATGFRGGQFTVTSGTGGGSGFSTGTQTGGAGGQATLASGTGGAVTTPTTTGVGGAGGAGGYTLGNGGAVTGTTGTQTGGAGGAFTVSGGTGGAVAGTAGATGGAGSSITNRSGVGGAATGASGTRTGGASGNIVYQIGAAGTGASANGVVGVVQFEVPSNTVMVQITSTNVQIQGVTDASASVAGKLGEYAESLMASGSAISLTTATVSNITSISLTAGDWDVSGNVNIAGATATYTQGLGGISTTSATVPTDGTEVYSGAQFTLLSVTDGFTLPRKRINVSSTTTVYLVAKATFSAGTMTGYGSISARRVR